jgi:putative addiction module component (TIGR02574 family)
LHTLTLSLVDEPKFNVRVRLREREVVISVAALEYLWASAHAHLILYNEYCLAQRSGAITFDTGGTERSRKAMELLAWAGRNILGDGTDQWQASVLTVDEQIELAEAIWDGIVSRNAVPPLTEAQKTELDRRLADHLANPDDVTPWSDEKAAALAKIRQ